jgi:hypothetical protein
MRAALLAVGASIAGGLVLLACNAVLGIDKAEVEPGVDGGGMHVFDAGNAGDAGDAGEPGMFVAQDDCNDYCNDMALSCGAPENQEWLSNDVCKQMCAFHTAHYDEQGINQAVDVGPTTALAMGDSIYCRVWHSHAALVESPVEHCPHAGPLGGLLCGTDPCDDFCNQAFKFCGTMSYPSVMDCLQACEADGGYPGFPYLMGADASDLQAAGNTLNCRMYHLENFLFTGDPVHCTHITPEGGGVCSTGP